ncbi:MAG: ABC transporter substrate-binding protein, partial [Nitrospirae bacterium YQR-1]
MYKYFIRIIIAILIIIFCFACEDTSIVSQRYKKSKKGRDNITIAVAGSWDKINYRVDMLNAVALAVEEINSTNMLNGRKIVLIAKHDSADINKARLIATEIANNTDVVAVIGHSLSFITSSVDDIYSIGGLLMLSPSLYIPDKIKKTIPMMFSYTPNPDSIAETFIRYMKSKNYKSAAVAYLNEDSSIKILNSFYNIG